MDFRKLALEDLLNAPVEKVDEGVYKWRGLYFEILPYKKIKYGWSQYNKLKFGNTIYGYKEATNKYVKRLSRKNSK